MTIAEIRRIAESRNRTKIRDLKEKAVLDYNLANLIGVSISRVYSKSNKYPSIEEAYPTLFTEEEIAEAKENSRIEKSVANFRAFADRFNKNFDKGVAITNE